MTADIFRFRPVRPKPDPDAILAKGIADLSNAFLAAIREADQQLCAIEIDELTPSGRHLLQSFAEDIDEMEKLADRLRVTRNRARYTAHYSTKGNGK